jgi:GTP-binding protein EngB required for normal cell division
MPESCLIFTGRPNAGKSSIIREVVGLNVAIGKRPGTTRQISTYPLSGDLVLVDMPGFGRILKASKRLENKRNDQIIKFLESHAQSIALAVHVLDISRFMEVTWRLERRGFISVDVEMVQFLTETLGEFPLVAANKIDKVDKEELKVNLEEFILQMGKRYPFAVGEHVFPVSAKTREGLGDLKNSIHKRLVAKGHRTPFKVGS